MSTPDILMKKITLGIEAGTNRGSYALTPAPVILEFICGAGVGELTPLEISLDGLGVGDARELELEAAEIEGFFGRLYSGMQRAFVGKPLPATIFLRLTPMGLAEPEPREVVQALARSLGGGGCGGNCGCGCG